MKPGISEKEEAKRLRLLELWFNKINAELDDEHQLIKSGKNNEEWYLTLPEGRWYRNNRLSKDDKPFIGIIRYDDTEDFLKVLITAAKQYTLRR